ncbi:hypothetical protein [Victivallis vadensis]|uniref:hypothetical protein n=1 Tax=Victivallis vadensis TaxID=172901 RepID=UPI00307EDE05
MNTYTGQGPRKGILSLAERILALNEKIRQLKAAIPTVTVNGTEYRIYKIDDYLTDFDLNKIAYGIPYNYYAKNMVPNLASQIDNALMGYCRFFINPAKGSTDETIWISCDDTDAVLYSWEELLAAADAEEFSFSRFPVGLADYPGRWVEQRHRMLDLLIWVMINPTKYTVTWEEHTFYRLAYAMSSVVYEEDNRMYGVTLRGMRTPNDKDENGYDIMHVLGYEQYENWSDANERGYKWAYQTIPEYWAGSDWRENRDILEGGLPNAPGAYYGLKVACGEINTRGARTEQRYEEESIVNNSDRAITLAAERRYSRKKAYSNDGSDYYIEDNTEKSIVLAPGETFELHQELQCPVDFPSPSNQYELSEQITYYFEQSGYPDDYYGVIRI